MLIQFSQINKGYFDFLPFALSQKPPSCLQITVNCNPKGHKTPKKCLSCTCVHQGPTKTQASIREELLQSSRTTWCIQRTTKIHMTNSCDWVMRTKKGGAVSDQRCQFLPTADTLWDWKADRLVGTELLHLSRSKERSRVAPESCAGMGHQRCYQNSNPRHVSGQVCNWGTR